MKIENVDIELLIPDPNNANTHNEKNLAAIRGSIKQFDVVEPLVVRRQNNVVVGGNGRLVVLKELGYKTVPVHYVDFDDQKAKALALALNRTSELSEWNMDILGATLQELNEFDFDIGEIGFDLGEFALDKPEGNEGSGVSEYTDKIEAPIYKPTGPKPDIEDLFDLKKTNELIKKIDSSDLPEQEKRFLRFAAYRHIVFRYDKIAEYYAHSEKPAQDLMENSALVIIDFEKAVELGFVKLTKSLGEAYNDEQAEVSGLDE